MLFHCDPLTLHSSGLPVAGEGSVAAAVHVIRSVALHNLMANSYIFVSK